MKHIRLSYFFSLCISLGLLISPLPLSAMAEEILLSIPECDKNMVMHHVDESYIYLGQELSGIIQLVSDLSSLDLNANSPLAQLKNHIDSGCNVAQYDAIAEVMEYMQTLVYEHHNQLSNSQFRKMICDIDILVDQIHKGHLTVDAHALESAQNIARGYRSWTNIMQVKGLLSVNDQFVQNITAVDLSVTDTIIQNATIDSLSIIDSIVTNETVTTLSITDLIVQNIKATNISVIDETVTGTLSINDAVVDNYIRFTDAAGGQYVGLQAPSVVPTSYTVSLPTTVPTANQVLQADATTPTNLNWVTQGGSYDPAISNTIYVTKYGNDTTGDGSFDAPYLTLAKAIDIANGLASVSNPVAILMSPGVYTEDNSAGPLIVTVAGIAIVGVSPTSVIIEPNTPANNLLLVNDTVRIANITFESSAPTGTGVSLAAGNVSIFTSVHFKNFLIGVNCAGGPLQSYGFNNCYFADNATALNVSNSRVSCNGCTVFGTAVAAGPALNNGITATGVAANLILSGGVVGLCVTGMEVTNNAIVTASSVSFRLNEFDIVQNTSSHLTLSGCTFELTDGSSDIDVQIDGAGTIAEIIGCEFSGTSPLGVDQGVSIVVTNEGLANISGGVMHNYTTGIQAGLSTDTFSTVVNASGLIIRDCTADIIQNGTTTLLFNSCTASSSKITINDGTNVEMAYFDLDDNGALTIGSSVDQDTILVQVDIDTANHPGLDYKSSLYSTQAIGFDNPFGSPSSLYSLSADNADLTSVTTNRAKTAGLRLVSDTGSPVGGTSALRGWDVEKNASSGALSFTYQNSDLVGQTAVSPYVVMQLDGFNNQLQLPATGTQIVFATDTNLYRDSANVLKTDDNLIVGTLTPDRAVVTAAGTNQLASSAVTGTELGYLSGVTSSVQTQLNGKVAKAGDIMTGTLQLPAGTTALPSLVFTGSTTTGLSAPVANSLSFSTNAVERMKIGSTGTISINAFGTAGVVHNDASGNLSSSLIVDGDITNATISNAKLATISSANTSGYIVVRDGSGNFSTNMISIAGTTTNPTDVATKSYVDAAISGGISVKEPAEAVSISNETLSGFPTIDGVSFPTGSDRVLLTGQTDPIENGLWVVAAGAWTRPTDFDTGDAAGQAYVLILQGAAFAGVSYLCSTPTAIIGTDPIVFELFSLPDVTTGANVGSGTGLVFRNKTGITLNFRSLLAGTHVNITNNADDITLATDATSTNTPSTIVARDGSGNFAAGTITASLTGAASLNVLKAGDTMTGALTMPAGTVLAPSLNFTGSTTSGLSASGGDLSFSTNALERLKIANGGTISIDAFTTDGVVHNDASGNLSSSLIVNADVDPAAAIVDTKLATISTAGKVANSATTATALNTPNTIVLRNGSGDFAAGTITASLTGAASDNVLKAGDTMTGTLQLPAGTTALPSLVFTGSTTTGLSADTGDLSFSTDATERLKIASGGAISVNAFTTAGVVHNDALGDLSSSLIVNADVDPAAAIIDTKLATISTAGKVANSATTATSSNAGSTIVLRDPSGNFSAGAVSMTDAIIGNLTIANCIASACVTALSVGDQSITGTLSVNDEVLNGTLTMTALTPAGVVHNSASGLLSSSLIVNADVDPAAAIVDTKLATISTAGKVANSATTATSANTANTIVLRNASGNFSAGAISVTDEVVSTSLTVTPFSTAGVVHNNTSGLLSSSLIVDADITNATISNAKLATISSTDTAGNIVVRDGSGNFATNMITIDGTVTNPTDVATKAYVDASSSGITGANVGSGTGLIFRDKTGSTLNFKSLLEGSHIVITDNADDITIATDATSANTASTIVARNASGNFSAGAISVTDEVVSTSLTVTPFSTAGVVHNNASGLLSSSLIVNADVDSAAAIVDTKLATISTAGKVANSATTATSANTANTIVLRNASGDFSAGEVSMTDAVIDNLTIVNCIASACVTDLSVAEQSLTGTLSVNDEVLNGTLTITPFGTAGIVHNNASGLLSSSLIVNADVDPAAAIVDTKLATISTAGKVANSATTATSSDTPSTIVLRDGSGNFATNMITIDGTVTNPTDVATKAYVDSVGSAITGANVGAGTGLIFRNKTGSTLNFKSLLQGSHITITNNADDITIATDGTNLNTASTLVARDAAGNFSASIVSVTDSVASGNLVLSTEPSTSTAGNILKGSSRFIHDFGTNNTFVGINAGNFTMSGSGNNTGVGKSVLTANTTGANNTVIGASALQNNTIGTDNIAVGYFALNSNTTGASNIAVGSSALQFNTIGVANTAVGVQALANNTIGTNNTAVGYQTLLNNTTGGQNTAIGRVALSNNTTGVANTAVGYLALVNNTTGNNNTALGFNTLPAATTGSTNIAIGVGAGSTLTTGSGNIYINANAGTAAEATTTRIGTSQTACFVAGIDGVGVSGNGVVVDTNGQLGITLSSERFKHNIEDMGDVSADILKLRPVTFAYNADASEATQYGLIAEEVDQIFPAIVAKDEDGNPYTVRYHLLPVLLLNELQKQHATIEAIKQQYVTVEEMNRAINNLKAEINNFVQHSHDAEVSA